MTTILMAGRVLAVEEDSALAAATATSMPMALPEVPERASLDEVDDFVTTTASLEALHHELGRLTITQPLKQGTACALEAAVSLLRRQVGEDDRRVFVTESFTGRAARLHGTRVAMESIAETIKTLVGKILAWLKAVPARVITHLANLYKGANAYTAKAQHLAERAIDAKARFGNQRLGGVIEGASFVTFLAGHDSAGALLRDFETTYKAFNTHFSTHVLGAVAQHVNAIAADVLKADTGAQFTNETAAKEADKAIRWLQHNAFGGASGDTVLGLPFGQAGIRLSFVKHGAYQVGISVHLEHGKTPTKAQLPVLLPDEIVAVTHAMADQLNGGLYHDYPKIKNELHAMAEVLRVTCDKIVQRQAENGPGAVASLHFLKMLVDSQLKLAAIAYDYSHKVNAALVAYCEASLSTYAKMEADSQHDNVPGLQVTDPKVAANDDKLGQVAHKA